MALSTTFRQCAPDTTKFGKITQNKVHFAIFAVQFHSRSPIFVAIESLYTTSYYKNSSGDEIANVNFLRRYGTYVLQNTKKREPTSFNQLDDS